MCMKLRVIALISIASLLLSGSAAPQVRRSRPASKASSNRKADLTQYVNPFIGTGDSPLPDYLGGNSSANTFPGATLPFGMIQWSPDTENGFGKDARGSYRYKDSAMRGFSLTHLSGPGCPVYGDVPVMPMVGAVTSAPNAYGAKFSHANEKASPGFYEVTLDSGVRVRLTATARTGSGVFTYPPTPDATMLINLGRNATGVTYTEARADGDRRIDGSITSGGFCGTRNKYKLYFVAEFDRPFKSTGMWLNENVAHDARAVEGVKEIKTGAFVTFDATTERTVRMKVGLSYVSKQNAALNLRAENPGWNFDEVRAQANERWNEALRRIEVGGGTLEEKRVFYSALYHTLLHPNTFSDANGEYIGFDDKVHNTGGRTHYANFSGWDIYRSQMPLVALLFPREMSDMAQSLVRDAEQGGGLPIWSVANDESGAMVGDPSVPIIASAYALGARNFDTRTALKFMVKGAIDPTAKSKTYEQRRGLAEYIERGYIPMEQKGLRGSPSVALEYMIADFALARFAGAHGDAKTHQDMMRRAGRWTVLFDPEHKYIRGRWSDGSWLPGFDFKAMLYKPELPWSPSSHKSYVEGNAVQYTWMIPHNMRGLFDRIGGDEAVIKRLDDFFIELNAGPDRPHFFIGNEPVFGVPWAYNYARQPWKTQAVTRRVLTELFTADAGGLPGNDDLGATSSWIVLAALGMYPATPGVGGFTLNSPLFPVTTLRLKDGTREVRITASGAAANAPYVRSLRLNDKPYDSTWLSYEQIADGGTLRFALSKTPNVRWATAASSVPPSFNEGINGASRNVNSR